jgi:hypothetical protein
VALAENGGRFDDDPVPVVVSSVVGALLAAYVVTGVIRARTLRLVFAWILLLLGLIGGLVDLVTIGDVADAALSVLGFVASAVAVGGLATYYRSDWFAWQRSKPPAGQGASIRRLVAIGVVVGLLAGLIAVTGGGVETRLEISF